MFLREVLWAPFNLINLNLATPDTIVGVRDGVSTVSVGDSWQSGSLLVALLSRVDELGVGTREGSVCELCGCWCEGLTDSWLQNFSPRAGGQVQISRAG